MGMTDVTGKPVIGRQAEAVGRIHLSSDTILRITQGQVKKGNPLLVAEVAAVNAAKLAHLLIPHCHQIALDMVEVSFEVSKGSIETRCLVRTRSRTGVEMEALVGVTIALNTIWDMVKYLEKDERGQYPSTRITDIKVVRKEKDE